MTTEAFVWFWVRNRMPKRLWKKCMEFEVQNSAEKLEKHFIDSRTGIAHKVRKYYSFFLKPLDHYMTKLR